MNYIRITKILSLRKLSISHFSKYSRLAGHGDS